MAPWQQIRHPLAASCTAVSSVLASLYLKCLYPANYSLWILAFNGPIFTDSCISGSRSPKQEGPNQDLARAHTTGCHASSFSVERNGDPIRSRAKFSSCQASDYLWKLPGVRKKRPGFQDSWPFELAQIRKVLARDQKEAVSSDSLGTACSCDTA